MAKSARLILIILYLSFISLGLPDEILGVAWPAMRSGFGLPLSSAGILISLIAVIGAFSGFISGWFICRFSITTILIASGTLTACGILGYGLSDSWAVLILFAIPQGLGAGTIDASLNNYVAENYSSRHMNWLHGFWGIGATMGPLIMTFSLGSDYGWRLGYVIIASLQFSLTLTFLLTRNFWKSLKNTAPDVKQAPSGCAYKFTSPDSLNAMAVFFLYTGLEFSVGMWFYSLMVETRGVSPELAGVLISLYWGFLTFGRFGIGFIANKLGNLRIIFYSLHGALLCSLLLMTDNVWLNAIGLCGMGLSLSAIYPCSMHQTPQRFGSVYAKSLTGYQAGAGGLGVALLPPLIGVILNHSSLTWLPALLLVLVILLELAAFRLYHGKRLNLDN